MVGRKRTEDSTTETPEETPAPTPESQPAGSGAVPGSASDEETFGEQLKANAAGEQVQPGVNDGPKMVRYTGDSTFREITADNWASFGVKDQPTVRWERRTGHAVPVDSFTTQALNVLKQQEGFEVP